MEMSHLETLKQRQNAPMKAGIFNPFSQSTANIPFDLFTGIETEISMEQVPTEFFLPETLQKEVQEQTNIDELAGDSGLSSEQSASLDVQIKHEQEVHTMKFKPQEEQQGEWPAEQPEELSKKQQQSKLLSPTASEENSRKRRIEVHENVDNCRAIEKAIMPAPIIQNVVATVDMCTHLRLREISDQTLNSEYNPHRFAALIMRIFDPKSTALIFSTGKMVVTGAKSADRCRTAAKKFAKIIRKLGYNIHFNNFQIQNIVGSVDLGANVKLEILAASQISETDYEPELFPGLVYRIEKPKIVILVFVSGKIVLTGAKHVSEIQQAFNIVYPIIKAFTTTSRPLQEHAPAKKRNTDSTKHTKSNR